jgi:hypothetical protein
MWRLRVQIVLASAAVIGLAARHALHRAVAYPHSSSICSSGGGGGSRPRHAADHVSLGVVVGAAGTAAAVARGRSDLGQARLVRAEVDEVEPEVAAEREQIGARTFGIRRVAVQDLEQWRVE